MKNKVVPYSFLQQNISLTWEDLAWGYKRGFADLDAVKSFATERLVNGSDDPNEIELAGLTEADASTAGDLMQRVIADSTQDERSLLQRWLYLQLAFLFHESSVQEDALATVEEIYADFGYPPEIESFVRYMPAQAGYDPTAHAHAENIDRLISNWRRYLDEQKAVAVGKTS